jgi:hypothetical protein
VPPLCGGEALYWERNGPWLRTIVFREGGVMTSTSDSEEMNVLALNRSSCRWPQRARRTSKD